MCLQKSSESSKQPTWSRRFSPTRSGFEPFSTLVMKMPQPRSVPPSTEKRSISSRVARVRTTTRARAFAVCAEFNSFSCFISCNEKKTFHHISAKASAALAVRQSGTDYHLTAVARFISPAHSEQWRIQRGGRWGGRPLPYWLIIFFNKLSFPL